MSLYMPVDSTDVGSQLLHMPRKISERDEVLALEQEVEAKVRAKDSRMPSLNSLHGCMRRLAEGSDQRLAQGVHTLRALARKSAICNSAADGSGRHR